MRKVDELRNVIANQFACEYKAYDLKGICSVYGIKPDEGLNPMNSKRLYVLNGLDKLSDDDIWKLARKIVRDFEKPELIKMMEPYLADTELEFTFVTRSRIVEFLDSLSNMEGKMKLDAFLSFIWDMSNVPDIFVGTTVGEEIIAAVKRDKVMSYKELLTERLEIKYLTDESFADLLECLVKPEVREGEEQKKYVQEINKIIREDGYELFVSSQKSDVLYFSIGKKRIIKGDLKNLIFAPVGQKPDITIENSISNELRLIGNTDNCLFYNFEIGADGLQWNKLIEWWKGNNGENDSELKLYSRLRESLDSEPERIFLGHITIIIDIQ